MPSSWYALAVVDDARDATESLLRPVERGRWLRLAVVALFVGVGTGVPFGNGGTGGGSADVPSNGGGMPVDAPASLPDGGVVALVVAAVVLVVGLALVWSAVGGVMEFVLVAGLRDREVRLRGPFRRYLGRGLRLFGFRLAVGLVALAAVGVPVAGVVALGVAVSPALLLLALPLALLAVVVAIAAAVVLRLTTDFVVPAMVEEERGVLDGWRRLRPTLRAEWKQVGVYVVARFVLGVVAGIAVGLVTLVVALVLAVPAALVGGGLFALASVAGAGSVGLLALAPVVVGYALVVFVAALLVQVPAVTFVRYYSLAVLGHLVPALDFVGVEPVGGAEDGTTA